MEKGGRGEKKLEEEMKEVKEKVKKIKLFNAIYTLILLDFFFFFIDKYL